MLQNFFPIVFVYLFNVQPVLVFSYAFFTLSMCYIGLVNQLCNQIKTSLLDNININLINKCDVKKEGVCIKNLRFFVNLKIENKTKL